MLLSERSPRWASPSRTTTGRCESRATLASPRRLLLERRHRVLSLRDLPTMYCVRPRRRRNVRSTTARCASSVSAKIRRSIPSIGCPSSLSCAPRGNRRICRRSGRSRRYRGGGHRTGRNRRVPSRMRRRALRLMPSRQTGSIRVLSRSVVDASPCLTVSVPQRTRSQGQGSARGERRDDGADSQCACERSCAGLTAAVAQRERVVRGPPVGRVAHAVRHPSRTASRSEARRRPGDTSYPLT